jgi:membrane peptidoglycan carboxypeptidase
VSTERRRPAGRNPRYGGGTDRSHASTADWARPNGGGHHPGGHHPGGQFAGGHQPGGYQRPAGEDFFSADPASGGERGGRGGRGGGRGGRRYAAPEKKKGFFRKLFSIKGMLLSGLVMFILGAAGVVVAYAMTPIPDPNDFSTSQTTIVYWNDGETELGRFSVEDRESVTLDQIPLHVQQAVIAAEDRSFYENPGFDIVGIARAAYGTVRSGEITGGGSTITQQYVKNYHLTQDQTISRKVKELFISVKLDQQYTKDQILTDYLNTIWFGRGTYGVQTASRSYFGKPVDELELEEAIALAALIRNPDLYDPTIRETNEARFEARFDFVVNGMVETGALTASEAAGLEPPEIKPWERSNRFGGPNGYLLQQVHQELRDAGLEDARIQTGGLRVTTTFDQKTQKAMVDAVQEEFPKDEDGNPIEELHAGAAAIRPGSGAVLAMYGGPDAVEQARNDALSVLQPGSTMKPFGLVAALEEGISLDSRYHGDSPIEDERLGERGFVNNQNDWSNGGPIDLISATARSTNTAFIDLTLQEGYQKMQDAIVRAGVPEDSPGLDIAEYRSLIGIFNVSPMEMAEAYATLAAEGEHADWYTLEEVVQPGGGSPVDLPDRKAERVFDEDVVADTTYALTQVVDSEIGTGKAARELGRPAAGKTGTHEAITSWFAGYTPQIAATVMFYQGDGSTSSSLRGIVSGGTRDEPFPGGGVPAQTWTAFMKQALDGEPVLPFPERANVGEAVNPTPTPEPICPPGTEGTPPECTPIEEEEEPERECPEGTEGTPPNCVPIQEEDPDVAVPAVIGETQQRAERTLRRAGFEVAVQTVENAEFDGRVVNQDPPPGSSAPEGSTVTITVGVAPEEDDEDPGLPDPCDRPGPRPPDCDEDGNGDGDDDTNAFGMTYGRHEIA